MSNTLAAPMIYGSSFQMKQLHQKISISYVYVNMWKWSIIQAFLAGSVGWRTTREAKRWDDWEVEGSGQQPSWKLWNVIGQLQSNPRPCYRLVQHKFSPIDSVTCQRLGFLGTRCAYINSTPGACRMHTGGRCMDTASWHSWCRF